MGGIRKIAVLNNTEQWMSLKIEPFSNRHLKDAARLTTDRYQGLRAVVPSLPTQYGDVSRLLPMLADLKESASGVVAMESDDLVGFLLSITIDDFRGRRTVLSPEWANGAARGRSGRIYEAMVAAAATDWYADRVTSFLPVLFADDHAAADTLFRLGFGMLAMDAMRDLSPPQGSSADVRITRATVDDLGSMMALSTGLVKHLQAAPVFLLQFESPDRDKLAADLEDEALRHFLAWQDGQPVAFMKIGPATRDASTIIRDEGTASITGAYSLPDVRGQGLGTALLARCIDWAREAGYVRCGVDFEPTNVEANRFWRRHFQPVCFGVQRLLNLG
jgi:GNAT superfamily N-acetyltransferase